MNIIIFGASGGTGTELLTQALNVGHRVTAFCRRPELITQQHPGLSTFQGDALNQNQVELALKEHDAVLCALGMPNIRDKSQLRAKATENIISGMQRQGLKRLVCLSAFAAGDSYATMPFLYRRLIVPLMMKPLYIDHNRQEAAIRQSQLNWTVVRPAILTNGERTGRYQHGSILRAKASTLKISRADVADFMLKQLNDPGYLHASPSISY